MAPLPPTRCRRVCVSLLAFAATVLSLPATTEAQRRTYVDWMNQSLPPVPTWAEWQKKTGALPPDFDALPSANYLPDPFAFADGHAVKMPADWPQRRTEIRKLFEQHVIGSLPPKPKLDRVVAVDETHANGYVTRTVRLEYGPEGKIQTPVTLTLPEGKGPFPILIGGGSALSSLLRRGYGACVYPESVDAPSNLQQLYPNFDFATMAQRAWTVQLVVDYLETVPEVDKSKLAITGYSRTGKMATIAAAWDDRIAAVIAGSTGVGGVLPWRLSGERGGGEGIESTTRMFPIWFAPQLRFFAGHEDRLPVDANLLVALLAPRACLMNYGLNDEVSNVWANEQTYHSALRVYTALGHPERLGTLRNPGFHGANDVEANLDWLDIQFGRSHRTWPNPLLFPWSYADWQKQNGAVARPPHHTANLSVANVGDWEKEAAGIKSAIKWVLGETPIKYVPPAGGRGFGGFPGRGPTPTPTKPVANPGQLAPDVPAWVISRKSAEFGWTESDGAAADSKRIRFGSGLTGDLYFPTGTAEGTKLPAVVWLHGYSYPLGYMWVYRRDIHPILALVKAGYAVLAYDQCGFGSRMSEIGPFYDRTPGWSQLGRMVDDARSAIDALEKEPLVDAQKISLLGYTIGGAVALHTAALDARVKSVVAVSGFTPYRTDTAKKPTGGLARFSYERPVAPRLGLFIGHENDVPYDYDELLATIAPRPVLVVQPTMDRDATPADVHAAVERARKIYTLQSAGDRLALQEPNDYQRFPTATQAAAIDWLKQQTK
jgi:dienelactone hydrolase